MEKNELPIKDKKIIQDNQDNWVPTPPTQEGVWKYKGKDHDALQRYYRSQEKRPKQILDKKKI